jgi:hypothetical protein
MRQSRKKLKTPDIEILRDKVKLWDDRFQIAFSTG